MGDGSVTNPRDPPKGGACAKARADAAEEPSTALPGMKVTRHKVSEDDGSRGFRAGVADSRDAPGPSSPAGAEAARARYSVVYVAVIAAVV